MPAAARLSDKSQVDADAHGCPSCPHPAVGPVTVASPNVFINSLAAARQGDIGIHAACCGPNNFTIAKGSPTVYVNGKPLARLGDKCTHCGGSGPLINGSPNVMIDDGAGDAATLGAMQQASRQIVSAQSDAFEKGKATDKVPPKPIPDQTVTLELQDSHDQKPLKNANVSITANGKVVQAKSDGGGNVTAKVKAPQGTTYSVKVTHEGELPPFKAPPPKPAPAGGGDAGDATPHDGDVTKAQLKQIMPGVSQAKLDTYTAPLNKAMREFEINSARRKAAFIAQIAEETNQLLWVEELASGAEYNNRKDLGNTHPGDGPRYKGRGLIQVTGRSNYSSVGKALGVDLLNHPELLMQPVLACRSACYFFYAHGLNQLADAGSFYTICVRVNGGTNGLAIREKYWAKAKAVLGNSAAKED